MDKFALYACPTGSLAEQIQDFLGRSQATWGTNAAHTGLPCCMLIEQFEEQASTLPIYTQSLERAYKRGMRSRPETALQVEGLQHNADRLTLALTAPWLHQLMVNFACTVKSPTRKMPLRIQEHLRLTLDQGHSPAQAKEIAQLAKEMIDFNSPSHWEMRFYQRTAHQNWIVRQSWALGEGLRSTEVMVG
jgi:hypothetical protein